jgi:ribosomal protein S18 acetylase RimI-like enzyme
VRTAFQRQGIARQLLKTCELAMNLRFVRLSVARNNTAALLLYRSEGYYQVDLWKRYYNSGEDALVLEKDRQALDERMR